MSTSRCFTHIYLKEESWCCTQINPVRGGFNNSCVYSNFLQMEINT